MRKLLQNSLFAALAAWAVYGAQAHQGHRTASQEMPTVPLIGDRTSSSGPVRF